MNTLVEKPRWYVVKCKARQEVIADENLARQGYTTFLPRIQLEKRRRGKWQPMTEPMFPGYLFVRLEMGVENFSPIRSTKGVSNLVRFSTLPQPMPEGAVENLKDNLDADDKTSPTVFQAGSKVKIVDGAFTGWEGLLQAETADDRILVLLHMLGSTRTLAFPKDCAIPL